MPSLHLVLPVLILLVLGLCWSVDANPLEKTEAPGFVTNYITPMTNLSLDKMLGRWYIAEHVSFEASPYISTALCLLLDFHYDDSGILVVAPLTLLDADHAVPTYTLPVAENGTWDVKRDGVLISSHVVVYVDDRYLAVASCKIGIEMDCGAFTLVRHVEDADRQGELEDLHHRVAHAGVDDTDGGFVEVIEPCRSATTAAPDLSAQSGRSTPGPE